MVTKFKTSLLLLSLCISLLAPVNKLAAFEYSTDLGGGGYQQVRAVPHLAPAIVLAAVVIAAMVAVSIQSQNDSTHIDFPVFN